MRLFFALNLLKKEKDRIHRAARPLREAGLPVRWIEPANFHLTLKFLGGVRPDLADALRKAMEKVAAATRPFSVELGGFGAFPTIRRPGVIWVGADPTPALRCLKQDLEWSLANLGFDRESRAFHPHITLGKAESDQGAGSFRGLDEMAANLQYSGNMSVKRLDLMRSHLSREGARYTVVSSVELRGPPKRK